MVLILDIFLKRTSPLYVSIEFEQSGFLSQTTIQDLSSPGRGGGVLSYQPVLYGDVALVRVWFLASLSSPPPPAGSLPLTGYHKTVHDCRYFETDKKMVFSRCRHKRGFVEGT